MAGWFDVQRVGCGITMIREPLHAEDVKSYLVEGERDLAVIDTGLGVGDFAGLVRSLSDREPLVVQTHAHWDHIGASWQYPRVLIHPSEVYALRRGFPNAMMRMMFDRSAVVRDALPAGFDPETAAIAPCEPSGTIEDGDTIDLGGRTLEVIHTPGHSPGGVSLLDSETRILFSGDSMNCGAFWLYLPRSDAAAFRATLHRLARLVDERDVSAIYASHSDVPVAPGHVHQVLEAYEAIWAGRRTPDRHELFNIGFPEKVPSDIYDFGSFSFLLGTGRYGEGVDPRWRG